MESKKIRTPKEVIDELGGKCRYCGKKLLPDLNKIEIDIREGYKRYNY